MGSAASKHVLLENPADDRLENGMSTDLNKFFVDDNLFKVLWNHLKLNMELS